MIFSTTIQPYYILGAIQVSSDLEILEQPLMVYQMFNKYSQLGNDGCGFFMTEFLFNSWFCCVSIYKHWGFLDNVGVIVSNILGELATNTCPSLKTFDLQITKCI